MTLQHVCTRGGHFLFGRDEAAGQGKGVRTLHSGGICEETTGLTAGGEVWVKEEKHADVRYIICTCTKIAVEVRGV